MRGPNERCPPRAWLRAIGEGLRAEYAAIEAPVPERLAALPDQVDAAPSLIASEVPCRDRGASGRLAESRQSPNKERARPVGTAIRLPVENTRHGAGIVAPTLDRPPWQSRLDWSGSHSASGSHHRGANGPPLAQDATLLERRSRTYVLITSMMILFAAFGFIWLTW